VLACAPPSHEFARCSCATCDQRVSAGDGGCVENTTHRHRGDTDRRRREGGRKETGRRREGGSRRPDTRQTHTGKRGYEDQRGGRRMRSLARLRPRQARRRARPPCAPALVSASPAPRTLLFLPPWQIQESQGLSASLSEADSMSLSLPVTMVAQRMRIACSSCQRCQRASEPLTSPSARAPALLLLLIPFPRPLYEHA